MCCFVVGAAGGVSSLPVQARKEGREGEEREDEKEDSHLLEPAAVDVVLGEGLVRGEHGERAAVEVVLEVLEGAVRRVAEVRNG